jgi:hypothetical protein
LSPTAATKVLRIKRNSAIEQMATDFTDCSLQQLNPSGYRAFTESIRRTVSSGAKVINQLQLCNVYTLLWIYEMKTTFLTSFAKPVNQNSRFVNGFLRDNSLISRFREFVSAENEAELRNVVTNEKYTASQVTIVRDGFIRFFDTLRRILPTQSIPDRNLTSTSFTRDIAKYIQVKKTEAVAVAAPTVLSTVLSTATSRLSYRPASADLDDFLLVSSMR